jgi:type IV secretion system protein VirD4
MARLYPLLTQEVRRMLSGSDFTGQDLMRGDKPATVYLRVPEEDLSALAPITRLVLDSLIHELFATYKQAEDAGVQETCRTVFFFLDEAGRSASLASLPDHLTTARSRGISILLGIQTLSQLTSLYHERADDVLNNCLSHVYFEPFSYKTARELSAWLGYTSEFATAYSTTAGHETGESRSEREVPLKSPDEMRLFGRENVLIFRDDIRPFLARRLDWHRFALLVQRAAIAPPPVSPLPPLPDALPVMTEGSATAASAPDTDPEPHDFWRVDRSLYRRGPRRHASNGMRKPSSSGDSDNPSQSN